jgi:hypothetical protein
MDFRYPGPLSRLAPGLATGEGAAGRTLGLGRGISKEPAPQEHGVQRDGASRHGDGPRRAVTRNPEQDRLRAEEGSPGPVTGAGAVTGIPAR